MAWYWLTLLIVGILCLLVLFSCELACLMEGEEQPTWHFIRTLAHAIGLNSDVS